MKKDNKTEREETYINNLLITRLKVLNRNENIWLNNELMSNAVCLLFISHTSKQTKKATTTTTNEEKKIYRIRCSTIL